MGYPPSTRETITHFASNSGNAIAPGTGANWVADFEYLCYNIMHNVPKQPPPLVLVVLQEEKGS